ncbi:hypothetical protein BH10PSE14_BH10PSE14_06620 [soil metagenome]
MADPNARQRIVAAITDVAQDGAALGGAALITYGVALIYHPAGFIVGGVFLLAGAWLTARKSG